MRTPGRGSTAHVKHQLRRFERRLGSDVLRLCNVHRRLIHELGVEPARPGPVNGVGGVQHHVKPFLQQGRAGVPLEGKHQHQGIGAGALLVVSERFLREHNLTPLAKFSSFAVKGVPPEIMGIGPKFAIPDACKAAGITQPI